MQCFVSLAGVTTETLALSFLPSLLGGLTTPTVSAPLLVPLWRNILTHFNIGNMTDPEIFIDASAFQKQLAELAETIAQKVLREGRHKLGLGMPEFVTLDLHVLIRHAMRTYDLLFYINSEERRKDHPYHANSYSVVTLSLIRNMIDDLFNLAFILENPGINGPWFRKRGYRKLLESLDRDEAQYGTKPDWAAWIKDMRDVASAQIQMLQLNLSEINDAPEWPTLGTFVKREQYAGPLRNYMTAFMHGPWKEYSEIAHGTFEAFMGIALPLIEDSQPLDKRKEMDKAHPGWIARHLFRAAGVLLCIVTELQAYFRFDDSAARINERIHAIWDALLSAFAVKELYDQHYRALMERRGI